MAEDHLPALAVGGGDLGLEELEHVEVREQRVARVEVEGVLAAPVERLALHRLQPGEVDVAADERPALQRVWLAKRRRGWTAQQYSRPRVWRNTKEWTTGAIPVLFQCGDDQRSDCVE